VWFCCSCCVFTREGVDTAGTQLTALIASRASDLCLQCMGEASVKIHPSPGIKHIARIHKCAQQFSLSALILSTAIIAKIDPNLLQW
jgi:hypothetical protein